MEAVAWLEGLPHSDRPACTCPVIGAFVRGINDAMPDDIRQRLVAYLPRLVGTVAPEFEQARAEYLTRMAVTVIAPLALEARGFHEEAADLRAMPPDASMGDLRDATDAAATTAAAAAAAATTATTAYAYADAADAAAAAIAAAATTAATAYANAAATANAGAANRAKVWDAALSMLDGVLAIGPAAAPFAPGVEERVESYRKLVGV
jgi:hypothetical protein